MAHVLIAYASVYGQTQKIVERMQSILQARGHHVESFDVRQPSSALAWGTFDVALIGAPLHAGGYSKALLRFLREHRARLLGMRSAFFSVGLAVASRVTDGRAQTLPLVEAFLQKAGWQPSRVECVAGALCYSKYNWLLRRVMRSIARKEGGDTDMSRDYEYTDWPALERFSVESVEGTAPARPEPRGSASCPAAAAS